ncbi:MAG: Eco57I restriction-modification methylase domain-containing protein [Thermoplasmatota archaeon]
MQAEAPPKDAPERRWRAVFAALLADARDQGLRAACGTASGDEQRGSRIASEIESIRVERAGPSPVVPPSTKPRSLREWVAAESAASVSQDARDAIDAYLARVALLATARLLLARTWAEAGLLKPPTGKGTATEWCRASCWAAVESLTPAIARITGATKNAEDARVARDAGDAQAAVDAGSPLLQAAFVYGWFIPQDGTLQAIGPLLESDASSIPWGHAVDILGRLYEECLDRTSKKAKGQYYTPPVVISLLYDRLGFGTSPDEKPQPTRPLRILDPAAGAGGFLVEAIRRRLPKTPPFPGGNVGARPRGRRRSLADSVYGCEISPFAAGLAEVNVLLALSPHLQAGGARSESTESPLGRFEILCADALSLTSPQVSRGGRSTDDEHAWALRQHVRRQQRWEDGTFDLVVGNPPYVGEDDHKELFRATLSRYPAWKEHYTGKMDYLNFFIILGLRKLRPGGRLAFLTPAYWLTADGGRGLRRFVVDHARIVEVIDFGETRLFERARGHHSIAIILEREPDVSRREANRIRVAEVKRLPPGGSRAERLARTADILHARMGGPPSEDDDVAVYEAPLPQGRLDAGAWFLFHSRLEEDLLEVIADRSVPLGEICEISQGVVPNPLRVGAGRAGRAAREPTGPEFVPANRGVFVLTATEAEALHLPVEERRVLRPFFKSSDVRRYRAGGKAREMLLYLSERTGIADFPHVESHLRAFRPRLERRRETAAGRVPWWSLHWPREERLFEGEKIVCPYRARRNTFAYHVGPFYGSTDLYFLKLHVGHGGKAGAGGRGGAMELRPSRSTTAAAPPHNVSLRYLTAVLNSSVIEFWTMRRTKRKGTMRELFPTQLEAFPIRIPSGSGADAMIRRVEHLVDEASTIKGELARFDFLCDGGLSAADESGAQPTVSRLTFLRKGWLGPLRPLRRVPNVSLSPLPRGFRLAQVSGDSDSPLGLRESTALQLVGDRGHQGRVTVPQSFANLVLEALAACRGKGEAAIGSIEVPEDIDAFEKAYRDVCEQVNEFWTRQRDTHMKIDRLVCEIYGIRPGSLNARPNVSKGFAS